MTYEERVQAWKDKMDKKLLDEAYKILREKGYKV